MSIRTLASKTVYRNRWLSVREDEVEFADGTPGLYSVVDRDDFALIIPAEDGGFHLVEQYRYTVQARSWEFPSGSFPPGTSGTPEEMAATELAEETGYTATALTELGYLHCANGMSPEGVHVFLATGLEPGEPRREVSEQDMTQAWFARDEVERMMRSGIITDAPSIAAYGLLRLSQL